MEKLWTQGKQSGVRGHPGFTSETTYYVSPEGRKRPLIDRITFTFSSQFFDDGQGGEFLLAREMNKNLNVTYNATEANRTSERGHRADSRLLPRYCESGKSPGHIQEFPTSTHVSCHNTAFHTHSTNVEGV